MVYRIVLLVMIALAVTSCGVRGNLYLPEKVESK